MTETDPETDAARDAEAKRIGARLKAARRALGITQHQMADRLGVHEKTYPKWESGERVRSWTRLIAAAEACDTTPSALLGYAPGDEIGDRLREALDPALLGAALEGIARLSAAKAERGEPMGGDEAFWTAMGGALAEVVAMSVRGAGAKEASVFLDTVTYSLRRSG